MTILKHTFSYSKDQLNSCCEYIYEDSSFANTHILDLKDKILTNLHAELIKNVRNFQLGKHRDISKLISYSGCLMRIPHKLYEDMNAVDWQVQFYLDPSFNKISKDYAFGDIA